MELGTECIGEGGDEEWAIFTVFIVCVSFKENKHFVLLPTVFSLGVFPMQL